MTCHAHPTCPDKGCLWCNLNPEPTQGQLALFARHKAAGTSPGNPKWYKPVVVKPFEFKAGQPARFPRYPTGAAWNAKYSRMSAHGPVVARYVGE